MEDKLIIKYIKKRNPKGMDLLIENYSGLITSVVRSHLGTLKNYEEECVSDVIFSVWESIDGYDKDKNIFKNWVCAIAKYKSINYRKKYLDKNEILEITDEIHYVDDKLIKAEVEEDINEILDSLSEEDKELFIKYYLEGYKLSELAMQKDTSISNLHSRLSRGRKRIRKNFKMLGGKQ